MTKLSEDGHRIYIECPRCKTQVNLGFDCEPKITYNSNGPEKGFLTASISVGGTEHRCSFPEQS